MVKAENTEDYTILFKDYTMYIYWPSSEPINTNKESIDVRVLTTKGEEYSINFTTMNFIQHMFEKNKRTGECVSGKYFCMPGMILVEKIDEPTIKATLDDLIKNSEIKTYVTKVN